MELRHSVYAQKWYDELVSGNYNQGIGALRRYDDTYCCLGVLGDILVEDGLLIREFSDDYFKYSRATHDEEGISGTSVSYLPYNVFKDLDLRAQDKYSKLNDAENASFEDIAQVVKEQYID